MHIASTKFDHNTKIPSKYTCDGEDINPPLDFAEVPEDAGSLVIVMDDPDAPKGTWVHWTVWNIPPELHEIDEDTVPETAVEGVTSFGTQGYGGPCPPDGEHRYFFKLYALDTVLELPNDADKAELEEAMAGHILDEAELIGLYSR